MIEFGETSVIPYQRVGDTLAAIGMLGETGRLIDTDANTATTKQTHYKGGTLNPVLVKPKPGKDVRYAALYLLLSIGAVASILLAPPVAVGSPSRLTSSGASTACPTALSIFVPSTELRRDIALCEAWRVPSRFGKWIDITYPDRELESCEALNRNPSILHFTATYQGKYSYQILKTQYPLTARMRWEPSKDDEMVISRPWWPGMTSGDRQRQAALADPILAHEQGHMNLGGWVHQMFERDVTLEAKNLLAAHVEAAWKATKLTNYSFSVAKEVNTWYDDKTTHGTTQQALSGASTLFGECTLIVYPEVLPIASQGKLFDVDLDVRTDTEIKVAFFSTEKGNLPGGFELSPSGKLTGTPNAAGSYPFLVRGTLLSGQEIDKAYVLTVQSGVILRRETQYHLADSKLCANSNCGTLKFGPCNRETKFLIYDLRESLAILDWSHEHQLSEDIHSSTCHPKDLLLETKDSIVPRTIGLVASSSLAPLVYSSSSANGSVQYLAKPASEIVSTWSDGPNQLRLNGKVTGTCDAVHENTPHNSSRGKRMKCHAHGAVRYVFDIETVSTANVSITSVSKENLVFPVDLSAEEVFPSQARFAGGGLTISRCKEPMSDGATTCTVSQSIVELGEQKSTNIFLEPGRYELSVTGGSSILFNSGRSASSQQVGGVVFAAELTAL